MQGSKRFALVVLSTAVALGLAAAPAKAVTINFSEFAVGTVITNQYAPDGVLFSAGFGGSAPIIANDGAMPDSPVLSPNPPYAGDFFMNFTTPVTSVSFDSGFWDEIGTGVINVYHGGFVVATFTNTTTGPEHMTAAWAAGIDQIYFNSDKDPAGADIDNLTFTPVPEPATLGLLGAGLIGLARRRARRS